MRILVSGGGTAGHVSPVLATVDALRARDKSVQITFVGTYGGMERSLAQAADLRFIAICGGKLRRSAGQSWWRNLVDIPASLRNGRDILLIGVGLLQALWWLLRLRPQVIFNKVGPTGVPVGIAAHLLRIPMVIHEPDVVPGLGNRLLGRWAAAIAVGFPASLYDNFPADKVVYTGNPVRPQLLSGDAAAGRKRFGLAATLPVVLVVGGSQGATRVNTALLAILPGLAQKAVVLHIAGAAHYARLQQTANEQGIKHYRVERFLNVADMALAYAAADIVVARAGANTIAELAALHKPTILLPNQQSAAHQLVNARQLGAAGAVLVASDDKPEELLATVEQLLHSAPLCRQLSEAIATFNKPNAARELADLILSQVVSV